MAFVGRLKGGCHRGSASFGIRPELLPFMQRTMFDFRRADLHTHTLHSDGQLAPTALVHLARERGLRALAVTDHDCIDGIEEAQAAGRRAGVEVVTGVELSVTVGPEEVHLLGYFFDPSHAGLRKHLTAFIERRRERAAGIVEALNGLGLPLRYEDVQRQAQGNAVGRPHVAQALVEAGYAATYQDAFEQYLRDGGPAFVAKPLFPAQEALGLLHDAGGLGVLAHPGHWISDRLLKDLVQAGLDGVETVHPSHDAMLTQYWRRHARAFGLIETGGSDYHGFRPQDDENFGRFSIPFGQLEKVRSAERGVRNGCRV